MRVTFWPFVKSATYSCFCLCTRVSCCYVIKWMNSLDKFFWFLDSRFKNSYFFSFLCNCTWSLFCIHSLWSWLIMICKLSCCWAALVPKCFYSAHPEPEITADIYLTCSCNCFLLHLQDGRSTVYVHREGSPLFRHLSWAPVAFWVQWGEWSRWSLLLLTFYLYCLCLWF